MSDSCNSVYVGEKFSLPDQGSILVTWPRPILPENMELVREWLKLLERKMLRIQPTIMVPGATSAAKDGEDT
jgi:hypothetical protein